MCLPHQSHGKRSDRADGLAADAQAITAHASGFAVAQTTCARADTPEVELKLAAFGEKTFRYVVSQSSGHGLRQDMVYGIAAGELRDGGTETDVGVLQKAHAGANVWHDVRFDTPRFKMMSLLEGINSHPRHRAS